jgi:hypothetical protein
MAEEQGSWDLSVDVLSKDHHIKTPITAGLFRAGRGLSNAGVDQEAVRNVQPAVRPVSR